MSIFVISQLAEYPIAPLSRELKPFDISYQDVIGKKKVVRKWRIYSLKPTGRGVYRALINLLQHWDGNTKKIYFSRRELLKQMGFKESGAKYTQLQRDLKSLTHIRIETTIPNFSEDDFCLFQHVHFGKSSSWIEFSTMFHKASIDRRNHYYLKADIESFNSLTPSAQRMLILLEKWFKHTNTFSRFTSTVYQAIPINGATERKRKQQLKLILTQLQQNQLIKTWTLRSGAGGEVVEVRPMATLKKIPTAISEYDIEKSLLKIQEFLRYSDRKSKGWWMKVAHQLPHALVEKAVGQANEHTQNLLASNEQVKNRGRILSHKVKEIAKENKIALSI